MITAMNQSEITCIKMTCAFMLLMFSVGAWAQTPLGTPPGADALPRSEFVFEERVTVGDPVVVGDTAFGHRQYIPITGGKIAGPRLNGDVLPGGWDYQLWLGNGCGTLSADYFLRAADGTIIHILNQSFTCTSPQTKDERSFFQPRFEAPKGKYDWLTRGTFVATLELEMAPATQQQTDQTHKPDASRLAAVRIKFYQIK